VATAGVRLPVSERPPDSATITRVSRRILIVDDHAGFRATARRVLEADGYEVIGEAADATSAIEAIKRLQPEVVLLDVQLPDHDGVEAATTIDDFPKAPAVVLTSSRPRDDLGPITADCVHGFIPKDELSAAAITELLR
jgi:DNA-binding NarL/FixJ family response regulator